MDSNIIPIIISAASAIIGSIIGSLSAMLIATRAHKRQLELQKFQLRGQLELKARELMFGVYQRKMEGFNQDIKELGEAIGKMGMVMHFDVEQKEKMEVILGFVGTVRSLTDPIIERMGEIECELKNAGLLNSYERQLSFIKMHLSPDLARMTPGQVESSYQNLSRALAYITELQNSLVEKKSQELFNEYLPPKAIQRQ